MEELVDSTKVIFHFRYVEKSRIEYSEINYV